MFSWAAQLRSQLLDHSPPHRVPLLQPSADLSWDPHQGEKKIPKQGLLEGGVCERALAAFSYMQTNKQKPTGKDAMKAGLCGRVLTHVYSWLRVKMRPDCSLF